MTYERKMREMIVASRIEHALTRSEILEIYLNSIYLGRTSWGIETAARSYFEAREQALAVRGGTPRRAAKGLNYYNPDLHPERAQERERLRAEPDAGGRRPRCR